LPDFFGLQSIYSAQRLGKCHYMENLTNTAPSITSILKKISDDRALTLFNNIAVSNGDKYIPLKEMNLTTKQYYSRISGLLITGLIKRHKGKYSLTMLGKAVYHSQLTIGKTLTYYWKLKALESIEIPNSVKSGLPEGELVQLINALIDNQEIKDILIKSISAPSS
jgi:predicted transcriptional regulator